jgi:hypothetical protein
MSDTGTFEPSRYLVQLKGKDYLEVKWRLVWLRNNEPNATIETELISLTDQQAVFRATVKTPAGASATGFGSETPKDFGDFIEKAETKAVGRALGMLGYGTQFSYEFEEAHRIVDSPVERPQLNNVPPRARTTSQNTVAPSAPQHQAPTPISNAPQPGSYVNTGVPVARDGVPPTDKQFNMIGGIRDRMKWTDADLHAFAGVSTLHELDRKQVSELIDALMQKEKSGDHTSPAANAGATSYDDVPF